MSSWSRKRHNRILTGIIFILVVFLAFIIIPKLKKQPNCFDQIQNGNEKGIDCGGSCALFCSFEVKPVLVKWFRALPVQGNFYNAVVYIENQNKNAIIKDINYEFKFYDENNVFITEKKGHTFVGIGTSSILEPLVDMKGHNPARTTFKFIEQQQFTKINQNLENVFVSVEEKNLTNEDTSPKLFAVLKNNSKYNLTDVEVVALLYDKDLNAVSASRTYVDSLIAGQTGRIFFTWPNPFLTEISKIEIIPRLNYINI